jgi:putative inorganic carbon (HCO3(-)) transporter
LALKVKRLNTINNNFLVVVIAGTAYGIFGYIVAGQFVSVAYYPFFWIGLSTIVSGVNVLKLNEKQQT